MTTSVLTSNDSDTKLVERVSHVTWHVRQQQYENEKDFLKPLQIIAWLGKLMPL